MPLKVVACLAALAIVATTSEPHAAGRLNVLFLIADDLNMYPREGITLPALSEADRSRTPAAAYRSALKEQDSMTDDQRREAIQAYRASTTFMDAQVGLVLTALDRLE